MTRVRRILRRLAAALAFGVYVWFGAVATPVGSSGARRAGGLPGDAEERWTAHAHGPPFRCASSRPGSWSSSSRRRRLPASPTCSRTASCCPGSESERAGDLLEEHFGQKPEGSFTLVVRGAPGSARSSSRRSSAAARARRGRLPTGRVVGVQPVSDRLASATIVSELQPADAKGYTDELREAAGTIPGARLYVTGQAAIEHDLEPVESNDLKVGELFIAIPIALLILVFVFGTLAFLAPVPARRGWRSRRRSGSSGSSRTSWSSPPT